MAKSKPLPEKIVFDIPGLGPLPILADFDPPNDIGETGQWHFSKHIHGVKGNDGISAFGDILSEAHRLPPEKGKALLFHSGRSGQTREDRWMKAGEKVNQGVYKHLEGKNTESLAKSAMRLMRRHKWAEKNPCPYYTGSECLAFLEEWNLADPILLWSLAQQKNEEVLRYMKERYGVSAIETMRRNFRLCLGRGPTFHKQEFGLCIMAPDKKGPRFWDTGFDRIDDYRNRKSTNILILGKKPR